MLFWVYVVVGWGGEVVLYEYCVYMYVFVMRLCIFNVEIVEVEEEFIGGVQGEFLFGKQLFGFK